MVLLFANLPMLLWCLLGRELPGWARLLPAAAIVLMVVQVLVEGARWHMAPGYLVTIGLFFACSWPRTVGVGWLTAVMGIGLLFVAAGLGTVLPVFDLPKPTGVYPIGTMAMHLTDAAREETRSNQPGKLRELMIQIWYPAEHGGPGIAYRPLAETEFKKRHLALVRTHAVRGVPIAKAQAQYPLVLFAPSWTGRRDQNTVQVEELASHGFLVVGIDHPYSTALTAFPDGRTVQTVLGPWMDYSTDETFHACVRTSEEQLRIRAADVRFVLDEIARLNQFDAQSLFTGRIDMSRVGIFGHSLGGAVAAEVCQTEPRVKAGVNLDGVFFGGPTKKSIGKPMLVFSDDTPVATPAQLATITGPRHRELAFIAQDDQCIRQRLSESGGCLLTLRGARHMNFCDSPLYSPVRRLTHAGPIQPTRAMEIINAYMLAFFRAKLNGRDEPLLSGPSSAYPEVEFERFPKDKV
jgi:predicted dienelactone hydrolase